MTLSSYVLEVGEKIQKLINGASFQLLHTDVPPSKIVVHSLERLDKIYSDVLNLISVLDDETLDKEVGDPDGKIHQRDD